MLTNPSDIFEQEYRGIVFGHTLQLHTGGKALVNMNTNIQDKIASLLREFENKWKDDDNKNVNRSQLQQLQMEEAITLIKMTKDILKVDDKRSRDYRGHGLLRYCISFNDIFIELIRLLLEADDRLIFEKYGGWDLPLHFACEQNASIEVIQLLLEHDIDKTTILERNRNKKLPLHIACKRNASIEVIQLLLENDMKKKTILQMGSKNDKLALHYACKRNAPIEVIKLLLQHDIERKSIFQKDALGNIPLHLACKFNASLDVIKLLLQSDRNKKTVLDKNRKTKLPLHVACEKKASIELIQLLLQHDIGKRSILQRDRYGNTPLHCACAFGASVDVVQLLLQHDVRSIFATDQYNMLPLHYACYNTAPKMEIIRLILQHDMNNKLLSSKDSYGNTPLSYACQDIAPNMELIRLLLEKDDGKRTILERNDTDKLPLHYACMNGLSTELIQLLLQHDERGIFEKDRYGYLPLHFACQNKNSSTHMIRLLLYHDTEKKTIFEKDRCDGKIPLHCAYEAALKFEVIRLLLYYHIITSRMMKYICNISYYSMKIDKFLTSNYYNDDNWKFTTAAATTLADDAIEKVETFTSYCNLIEVTTLLELAIRKNNCLNGITVIIERTLDFLER